MSRRSKGQSTGGADKKAASSNTKAKKGTGRGQSTAKPAALRVPFGIVAASTARPEVFPPDDFYEGPPVSSVQSLRPQLLRQVFDATLWLRAFERSGGRFGRRRRASTEITSEEGHQSDADEDAQETSDLHDEDAKEERDDAEFSAAEQMLGSKRSEDGRDLTDEDERLDDEQQQQSGRADEVIFNSAKLKQLRQIVQIGTIDAILRGKYYLAQRSADGEVSNLREVHLNKRLMQRAANESKMYASDYVYSHARKSRGPKGGLEHAEKCTEIYVVEGDCVDAALAMKRRRGLNPLLLNMASRSNPCGGYRHGTGAQEENLTRRSNLMQCLEDPYRTNPERQWSYPLPEFGGIYTPKVTFFRGSEANGYAFMEEPEYVSVVSVAAYSNPPVEEVAGELRLSGNAIISNFKKKMKAIFNIALENGHDSLVLSAFGCGVFGNPPKHIAQLFREVLRKDFSGCFDMVVFAIIDGANTFQWFNPNGNVLPFSQVFQCPALMVEEFADRIALPREELLPEADQKSSTVSAHETMPHDRETKDKEQESENEPGHPHTTKPSRSNRQSERSRSARNRSG